MGGMDLNTRDICGTCTFCWVQRWMCNYRVFAVKEISLKIQANKPVERTLKEEFAKNGMKIQL